MSAVLRKKLESSGGLPPTVLRNRTFWLTLETAISGWLNQTLGGDNEVRLQSREVCKGAALADDLFGAYLYGYEHESCDFVVASSVDNLIAARVAGRKMQQDPATLTEAPQLFLQLLLETPAATLATAVSEAFSLLEKDSEPHEIASFENLELEGNCLVVYYLCDIDNQAMRVGVVLKMDRVVACAMAMGDEGIANAGGSDEPVAGQLSEPRVQNSSVNLNVIIDRVPMSIADCTRLEPGTVISLPGTHRSNLTISADTVDGPVDIAIGELGVWKHQRAVRLKTNIEPSFLQEVAVQ